jgi:hypothetical protein
MLIVFWGIRAVTLVDWLPQGAYFNGTYFDEHILQVIASELHMGEEKKHCPWPLVHMDNVRSHTSKRNLTRMEELRLKRVPIHLLTMISHHRTSFSSDGSKASSLLDRSASSMGFLRSSTKFWALSHLTQSRGFLGTGSKDWHKLLILIETTSDSQHNECKSISLKRLLIC